MAKAIMIQGTASNAGKSLLVAGLCRIFRQDGFSVAPFKSQNMALNSFVTREGLEMGRAQVAQAEAAGLEPSVLMNPILLKPTGDSVSQVIVDGEVVATMAAAEYYRRKTEFIPAVRRAYRTLAERHDLIVIEGAGSPAEINLRDNDIVNMGMAAMADAPVLLVGDIDRGGVFASLYGTAALLEPHERDRIRGFIVNKFRGDVEILRPGLKQLEDLTGIPVVGVVPWTRVDIDDEDSLSPRFDGRSGTGPLQVVVVRLPRIANFTDFAPLERHAAFTVRYVESAAMGQPDLIIIPGTKNTIADLAWMRQSGIETVVKRLARSGVPVMGICGGYQMLGSLMEDPDGVEGGGTLPGLELLPVATRFAAGKTRTRVAGTVAEQEGFFSCLSGSEFEGYEIHMGKTVFTGEAHLFAELRRDGVDVADGAVRGAVMGSYVHGLFDNGIIAQRLAEKLLADKGIAIETTGLPDYRQYKESQYDLLAGVVRESLDMNAVYSLIGAEGRTHLQ